MRASTYGAELRLTLSVRPADNFSSQAPRLRLPFFEVTSRSACEESKEASNSTSHFTCSHELTKLSNLDKRVEDDSETVSHLPMQGGWMQVLFGCCLPGWAKNEEEEQFLVAHGLG